MNFILLGLLWLSLAIAVSYFVRMKKKYAFERIGMALIIISFMLGIFLLIAVISI
jgi:hypothetical protein